MENAFIHKNRFAFDLNTKFAIYAQGEFAQEHSKTALGVLRYAPSQVTCVIDSYKANLSIQALTGINHSAPIVASIKDALAYQPEALVLGISLSGGKLPKHWRNDLLQACNYKLDIINGLHDFLSEDSEFIALANKNNTKLIDLRKPPTNLSIASGKARSINAKKILTIGSDCSSGKMTTAIELTNYAKLQNYDARFLATGQTGILIAGGQGIGIDRVIGDFMAGAIESLILENQAVKDFLFIEGQGSIYHPGFSGVTLSLMHGSCADGFILCHNANQQTIEEGKILLPNINVIIKTYELLMTHLGSTKVLGIAINTKDLTNNDAQNLINSIEQETNLPTTDPVRYGVKKLFDSILSKTKE